MNPNNFDKFPTIAEGLPSSKSILNTGEDGLTTDLTEKWCNNLSGQASIDESVRSIQLLIDDYQKNH